LVDRAYSVSDRRWLSHGVEIGRQKGRSSSSARTIVFETVELTDADLIARVLVDDDQHAFGELVRRHQSSVRGLLRQLTRTDVSLADDLAQETFIRSYNQMRSFCGES